MTRGRLAHEWALFMLACALSGALAFRSGSTHPVTLQVLGLLLLHVTAVELTRKFARPWVQRLRLALAYPVTLGLYSVTAVAVPALGLSARDMELLAWDERWFGVTPSVAMQSYARPWLTEVLSACYLSYHLYLHGHLVLALAGPLEKARRLAVPLFTAFCLGYAGYYLVPGVGPRVYMPQAFQAQLEGGIVTRATDALVQHAGGVFDVFPSLHVLITCVLLAHDAREARWRFRLLLPVALGLFVSTLYLRHHYAVDLLAGFLWFGAVEAARPWLLRMGASEAARRAPVPTPRPRTDPFG